MRKLIALALAMLMAFSVLPLSALAAGVVYDESTNACDCYNIISKDDYAIAPGINESEIVLNFDDGSRRQVLHVMEADTNNEYVSVINSYNGMYPEYGSFKTGTMTQQAAWAEKNMGINIVGAMNTTLSWYNTATYDTAQGGDSLRIGEPLGFIMLDAEVLFDPSNCGYTYGKVGFPSVLVINKDFDENGNPRPADIPKVEMPQITSAADLDGWEDQVIPASSGYIVKNGVNQNPKENHLTDSSNSASRSVVGIKPDGTVVIMMNDGRQSPYSAGMSMYECAEVMISLGCSFAVNCDGGGSSTFLSQRPGQDLAINCSPSDGAERPTTTGIFFVSTAPADGEFARANITSDAVYYTPGSTVTFDVLGTDLVGNVAEIPEDVSWQLTDASMGTIEDGVFVSNGKIGKATAQMVYEGEVVGGCTVEIVVPTGFAFSQSVMTVPFNKEVSLGLKATINDGLHEVVLKDSDVTIATTNSGLGTFNGLSFTSVSEENAPANLTSTVTATLTCANLTAQTSLSLGKGSEVLFDFEDANDIEKWNVADVNGNDKGFKQELSFAAKDNGQVHDGEGSMRVEFNAVAAPGISAGGYAQSDLFLNDAVIVENAKSIGFWAYIPDEYVHCWIRVLYWYDKDGDGKYESKNTVTVINQPEIYNTASEDGWYYFSVDVSAYKSVMLAGKNDADLISYNASKCDANNFRFIEFMFPHTNTMAQWQTYGTLNGPYTVYVDNITADFSDAVDDREAPIFGDITLMAENDTNVALAHRNTVTTSSNTLNVTAAVSENTKKTNATGLDASSAKAYVDGVEVDVAFANGKMTVSNIAVADGVHRVKFQICDMMGNKSVVIRNINVQSGVEASTVQVVPHDTTLDRLYGGSVYWMDVNATNMETIQSVKTVLDLNSLNHWELDYMQVAEGFSADYSVNQETNTATITFTRTGKNTKTGAATIASLPIRVVYYDTDINVDGFDAASFWMSYDFWPQDVKLDVDMGEITYVEGYTSAVLGSFSNDQLKVDTEMYIASQHMDAAYKTERGTAHVHTPVAIADKEATCVVDGYTGRTYCEVCDSVVDWGTTQKATGKHNYVLADGTFTCASCGDSYVANGLVQEGEKYYYYLNGSKLSGWQSIDNAYYYFDTKTYANVSGHISIDDVYYDFDEQGKLIKGSWANAFKGWQYFNGPKSMKMGWIEVDGNWYYIDRHYRVSGYVNVPLRDSTESGICYFDENGVFVEVLNGIYDFDGTRRYYVNGVKKNAGLVEIDGDYYFAGSDAVIATGRTYVWKPNGIVDEGSYYFDEDGKLIGADPNGEIVTIDGTMYYYENAKAVAAGLVEVDGALYFADLNGVIATGRTYVWKPNGIVKEGSYYFAEDGKMIGSEKGEISEINGVRYYCEMGIPQAAGLILIDGSYYFADVNGVIATGKKYVWKPNGIVAEDSYTFDAQGRMLGIKVVDGQTVLGQIVTEADGTLRYYEKGKAKAAGLILVDGYYYFADANGVVRTGSKYVWKTNGLVAEDTYTFDAEGKMLGVKVVDGETILGQIVTDANDTMHYYQLGKLKSAGLVEVDGAYYFADVNGLVVTGRKYVWRTNGLVAEDSYTFDVTGKMLGVKVVDGETVLGEIVTMNGTMYYYSMGKAKAAGLVLVDGSYYFADVNGVIATGSAYVWRPNGIVAEDRYAFDAEGKMVGVKVVDGETVLGEIITVDGTKYYYQMGKQKAAGLVLVDGAYYFADVNGVIATGRKYVWKPNGIVAEDSYTFDAEGKMVGVKVVDGKTVLGEIVTIDGTMYYYSMGKATTAGYVQLGDDFYFADLNGVIATGRTYVWKTNGLVAEGSYEFGTDGKAVSGFVTKDDGIYYYEKGVQGKAGIHYIDGYYYFVESDGKIVTNTKYYVWKGNNILIRGRYTFNELGQITAYNG